MPDPVTPVPPAAPAAPGDPPAPGPPDGMVTNRTAILGNLDIWTQRENGQDVAYVAGADISDVAIRAELQKTKDDHVARIAVIDAVLAAADMRRHGPKRGRR